MFQREIHMRRGVHPKQEQGEPAHKRAIFFCFLSVRNFREDTHKATNMLAGTMLIIHRVPCPLL